MGINPYKQTNREQGTRQNRQTGLTQVHATIHTSIQQKEI